MKLPNFSASSDPTVIPFDGVPARPSDPGPESTHGPEVKSKRRFLRFKPMRSKTSSHISTTHLASNPSPSPAPEPVPSSPRAPAHARQEEHDVSRRRRKFLEGVTGQKLGDDHSQSESESESESESDSDHSQRVDQAAAASQGKPVNDTVTSPINDPPPPPLPSNSSKSATQSTFHPSYLTPYDPSELPVSFPSTSPPSLPHRPHHPSSSENPAEMAEMFASRAFGNYVPTPSPFSAQPPALVPPQPAVHPVHPIHSYTAPSSQRVPIGWGNLVNSLPSVPQYGPPAHLTATPAAMRAHPVALDPALADKLLRGRELALLAIRHEEQSNLPAAETAYINALSLLIPASRELDVGPDISASLRRKTKTKVQRESAALLTRCEHIRNLMRASGPSVPNQMPKAPSVSSQPSPRTALSSTNLRPPPPSPPDHQDDLLSAITNLSVSPNRPVNPSTGSRTVQKAPSQTLSVGQPPSNSSPNFNSVPAALDMSNVARSPSKSPSLVSSPATQVPASQTMYPSHTPPSAQPPCDTSPIGTHPAYPRHSPQGPTPSAQMSPRCSGNSVSDSPRITPSPPQTSPEDMSDAPSLGAYHSQSPRHSQNSGAWSHDAAQPLPEASQALSVSDEVSVIRTSLPAQPRPHELDHAEAMYPSHSTLLSSQFSQSSHSNSHHTAPLSGAHVTEVESPIALELTSHSVPADVTDLLKIKFNSPFEKAPEFPKSPKFDNSGVYSSYSGRSPGCGKPDGPSAANLLCSRGALPSLSGPSRSAESSGFPSSFEGAPPFPLGFSSVESSPSLQSPAIPASPNAVGDICFLCKRPAQLKTKCGHTFCSSCGNRAVVVFGNCPVPGCGEPLKIEDLQHVMY